MENIKQKLFGLYPDYVEKIVKSTFTEGFSIEESYLQLRSIDELTEEESKIKINTETWHNETDYLRSIGIALPFGYMDNGEFKVMSVDEQIKNGWVALEGE